MASLNIWRRHSWVKCTQLEHFLLGAFCWNEKGAGLDACGALLYVNRYAAGTSDRNEQAEPLSPRHAKQLQTMDEVSNTCMSQQASLWPVHNTKKQKSVELDAALAPELPVYDHIVIVLEENKEFHQILGGPSKVAYLQSSPPRERCSSTFYGEEQHSQGNYFWGFFGSNTTAAVGANRSCAAASPRS